FTALNLTTLTASGPLPTDHVPANQFYSRAACDQCPVIAVLLHVGHSRRC
ncbi:hypothetical protein OG21DRAFT_1427437, partial [Imleria badia]